MPEGKLWAMTWRVSGSFFEGCCNGRVLLGVMRTRGQSAPRVTVQQAVDVVDGDLLSDGFCER